MKEVTYSLSFSRQFILYACILPFHRRARRVFAFIFTLLGPLVVLTMRWHFSDTSSLSGSAVNNFEHITPSNLKFLNWSTTGYSRLTNNLNLYCVSPAPRKPSDRFTLYRTNSIQETARRRNWCQCHGMHDVCTTPVVRWEIDRFDFGKALHVEMMVVGSRMRTCLVT
jgi:hypothetical protein